MPVLLALCCWLLLNTSAWAKTQSFELPTRDGLSSLHGQLDLPAQGSAPFPLVVMMPGTGLFDRNVEFGNPEDPRSAIFRSLAQALNQKGVATVRYDYRGVCQQAAAPACPDCQTPQEKTQHFVKICFDNQVRQGVTPENMRTDFEQVYSWGQAHPSTDPQRVVVLAHSEGSIHVSHLAAQQRIAPRGMVWIGGLFESPQSVVKWQMTERLSTELRKADRDQDGQITQAEITAYQPQNPLLAMFPLEALLADEPWTPESLKSAFEAQYQALKKTTLEAADSDPFVSGPVTQASMAWWKMFFSDPVQPAQLMAQTGIPVINHLGELDSQVNQARQQAVLDSLPSGHRLAIETYSQQGHALGAHILLGPMSAESETRLLESVLNLLKIKTESAR